MNSIATKWIAEEKLEEEQKQLRRQAQEHQKIAAIFSIQQAGPDVWRNLLVACQSAIDDLPQIGVCGQMCVMGTAETEQHCRIQVRLIGPVAKHTYTDLWYSPGALQIRGLTMEGNECCFTFTVSENDGHVGLVSKNHFLPMNEEEAAEAVIRPMKNLVKGNK